MANQKIYYAPIIIHGKADLDNYNIQWSDCRTLHFGTSGSVTIYPFPTESKELYNMFRKLLNNQHSDAYRATRCQVPGKRGRLVRCDTRNSCANCPFGIDPANKEPNSVSLDRLAGNPTRATGPLRKHWPLSDMPVSVPVWTQRTSASRRSSRTTLWPDCLSPS